MTEPASPWQPTPAEPSIASFKGASGSEFFIAVEAPARTSYEETFRALMSDYDRVALINSLSDASLVSLKFHLSDISNQAPALNAILAERFGEVHCNVIEQPPASGSKAALEAVHQVPASGEIDKTDNDDGLVVAHGPYRTLYGRSPVLLGKTSAEQTTEMLDTLSAATGRLGGKVCANLLRTWFYVRDIDNNYQGMVDARREWFIAEGLTEDTHYVASTGIEGREEVVSDLVHLDYISEVGLAPEQITQMEALANLNPTHEYGVTFERATRVVYGDRSHYYLSGTASIDNRGEVVHLGDVARQTHRTLDNVQALLEGYGAGLADLQSTVVYLRDPADLAEVRGILNERMPPSCAYLIVRGAVCRPTWLVEMDGIAVTDNGDERFPDYY